jgi:beta-1,4-N-acetylglucosaminyltransferase
LILVTVGTHYQGFNRLVSAMDELAAELDETVLIQRGSSTYVPQHADHFQFTSGQHMAQLNRDARVVVSHAAAGAIIVAMQHNRPLVVVPRLQRFDEHIDDHQLQLTVALEAQNRAVVVYEPSVAVLRAAIAKVTQQRVKSEGPIRLVQALRQQLAAWNPQNLEQGRSANEKV